MKTTRNIFKHAKVNGRAMGRLLFMALLMLRIANMKAQDIIFLRNGSEIKAKITEVSYSGIKYLNYNETNGPAHWLIKSDVFMVKYENGTREVFETENPGQAVVVREPVQRGEEGEKFDPDSSDFARIRRKKFDGPRVGFTVISPGTSADYLYSKGKRPLITQFGWQFEGRLFTVDETSGIFEFVPMIGGLEQGMFIPSANLMIGIRTGRNIVFEFAIGPNFSVVPDYNGNKTGFAGLAIAAGTSLRKGNVYFPITLAFVPSVGNVAEIHDPVSQTSSKVYYYTGSRISLVVGFNSRKK